MSSEGGTTPDEAQVSVRPATPAEPSPEVKVRPPTPATDVLAIGPTRDSSVARHLARWSSNSAGRLAFTGALILVMLFVVGFAGRFYVPDAATVSGSPSALGSTAVLPPSADAPEGAVPVQTGGLSTLDPTATSATDGPLPINTVHPGDLLAAWATPLATKLGIPVVALQAYAYADLATAHSQPACRLAWPTLAGIGKIESDHGRAQGATL